MSGIKCKKCESGLFVKSGHSRGHEQRFARSIGSISPQIKNDNQKP